MLVEESRILQVSIFDTLRKNDHVGNISGLLSEVMVIADEVDLQLAEAMTSFTAK
jgi:preprotein translocase subunit YajC